MITFTKNISTINFNNAFNNSFVEFSSDSVKISKRCDIDVQGNIFSIQPINNVFNFNFKGVLSALITSDRLIDTVTPSLVISDATSHIYDYTSNSYLDEVVTFTITFDDDTTEQTTQNYKFIRGVEQLEQYKLGNVLGSNDMYILSPFKKDTSNTYNVTYFEGYPFDVAFLLKTTGNVTFLNQTNGISYVFNLKNNVNRVFFSDGSLTITINQFLPLVDGLNELKITKGAEILYLNVKKVPQKAGNYIKWMNNYGGWSYWLFNCIHSRRIRTRNLGEINNDFNNISLTTDSFLELGKNATERLNLITENTTKEEQDVINTIFDSPKVYYFTGVPFSKVDNVSWLAVKMKDNNETLVDYKNVLKTYKLAFDLPDKYTIVL